MMKHTPGPWGRVFGSDYLTGNHPADIIGPRGYPIGHAIRPDPAEGGEYVANAQLMCAAPDLLAACKESLAALEREHRERQERVDQTQDEWNHRHADDINVPNDCAMWCGVEIEEPPVLSALRAAIAKAEGR